MYATIAIGVARQRRPVHFKRLTHLVNQAVQRNLQGVGYLAAGQPDIALACLKTALSHITSVCADSNGSIPESQHARIPSPLFVTRLSQEDEEDPSRTGHRNEAFLIAHGNQENGLTSERLSVYSAAIVFNCAVSIEHMYEGHRDGTDTQKQAACQKACRLYDHCIHLLSVASREFDCAVALNKTVRRMARNYYKLGDFHRVRSLLDSLLQLELNNIDGDKKFSDVAPSA